MKASEGKAGVGKSRVGAALPEGWREVELKDVINTITPPAKIKSSSIKKNGLYPVIDQSSSNEVSGYINEEKHVINCHLPLVIFGDHTCVVKYINEPFAQGADGIKILKSTDGLLSKFLYFFMEFKPVSSERYKRHFSKLKEMHIFMPPLPEQKSIVSLLETWDTAIEKTEALIAAKEKRFKWLLKTLITDQQDNPEWRKVRLGEIGKFSKGNGITKRELVESGIPCIRYGEIYTKHNFKVKKVYSYIENKDIETRKLLKQNDLLFAGSGETREEIGKCVSFNLKEKVYAGGDVIICSLDSKKIRSDFSSFYLNTAGRRQINKLGQGDSIVHIYSRNLGRIKIPIPSLSEQKSIVSLLEAGRNDAYLLQSITEKYRIQKRGLMQKLLTGKWRVKSGATRKE